MVLSPSELRDVAARAVEVAARALVQAWTPDMGEQCRDHGDKAIDRAVEAAIVAFLEEATPDIPVLAGETGGSTADRLWIIDPIDGTVNLLRGSPHVGISVGLIQAGAAVVGAVGAPLIHRSWSAAVGLGARDQDGHPLSVRWDREMTRVTSTGPPRTTSPGFARWHRTITAVLESGSDVRRCGAASLDLAFSAAGIFDGHVELGGLVAGSPLEALALGPWDVAAGALLVTEAGGRVTDWKGDTQQVFRTGEILAGAPGWHELMLEVIAKVDADLRLDRIV